jgi:hypothetical protein
VKATRRSIETGASRDGGDEESAFQARLHVELAKRAALNPFLTNL